MLALEVKTRENGSAESLRKHGIVPAVFYGPREKTTPISIDARELDRVWKAAGETSIVTLKGIGEDKRYAHPRRAVPSGNGQTHPYRFLCARKGKEDYD
jgi:ribosomal protein L25 (general stress protein Ctc)